MAAATSTDVVNEALAYIGYDGNPVTGVAPNFDNSVPGQNAARIYAPAVAATTRMAGWEFTRTAAVLVPSGNIAPFPWSLEYNYPAHCAEIWQVSYSSLADMNNPVPIEWARGVAQIIGVQSSVIWTNQANALAIFNGNPIEATWDSIFRALAVRYLASAFSNANLGKTDMAQAYFDSVGGMLQIGMERSDS